MAKEENAMTAKDNDYSYTSRVLLDLLNEEQSVNIQETSQRQMNTHTHTPEVFKGCNPSFASAPSAVPICPSLPCLPPNGPPHLSILPVETTQGSCDEGTWDPRKSRSAVPRHAATPCGRE